MWTRDFVWHREKMEQRRFSSPWRIIDSRLLLVLLLILQLSQAAAAAAVANSDGCDWIGSGLEQQTEEDSSRGSVHPVYLRCSQGSVSWLYPRGALRVVLRLGTAGKEFQGCLKLSPDFAGANVYVEQHRSLKLLHGRSSSSSSSPAELLLRPDGKRHCFDSHKGQVALFLETDSAGADPLRRETAAFDYDLQLISEDPQSSILSNDPWQECRPCSAKEALDLFCSSDFVARGSISAVYNDALLERTLLTVRASRVIRQASQVFHQRRRRREWIDDEDLNELKDDEHHVGTLHVPLTCQVKHGQGEFVFMGRQRLGDAVLWCAPRAEEWAVMIQEAMKEGSAQCRLES